MANEKLSISYFVFKDDSIPVKKTNFSARTTMTALPLPSSKQPHLVCVYVRKTCVKGPTQPLAHLRVVKTYNENDCANINLNDATRLCIATCLWHLFEYRLQNKTKKGDEGNERLPPQNPPLMKTAGQTEQLLCMFVCCLSGNIMWSVEMRVYSRDRSAAGHRENKWWNLRPVLRHMIHPQPIRPCS